MANENKNNNAVNVKRMLKQYFPFIEIQNEEFVMAKHKLDDFSNKHVSFSTFFFMCVVYHFMFPFSTEEFVLKTRLIVALNESRKFASCC